MKLHREGYGIVLITLVLSVLFSGASIWFLPFYLYLPVSLGCLVLLIMVLRFFRVPSRTFSGEEAHILAPADGKVVAVERVHEAEYLDKEAIQLSIFMSVHNVHVNYHPVSGKISYYKYHPGKYLLARHPKSSVLNERTSVGYTTAYGKLLMRQIAGYVARRVKCYITDEDEAVQGKEMGFIRFGSRVDLFLPPGTEILVKPGQSVRALMTPVARFK